MTLIKTSGFANGTNIGTVAGAIGAASASVEVAAFGTPPTISGVPRLIGSPFTTATEWEMDTSGLTGITAYRWQCICGSPVTYSTNATMSPAQIANYVAAQMSMGHGHGHGQMGWMAMECVITCDQGNVVSLPFMPYLSHGMADHDADDQHALDLVPLSQVTHIVANSGPVSDPATWLGGQRPEHNARVMVPRGKTLTLDTSSAKRWDWIRVDGTFQADLTRSVKLLFETMVITRGGVMTDGVGGNRRPGIYTSEWIISSRNYRGSTFEKSALNFAVDDNLMGRGIINQGIRRMWGKERTRWLRSAAGRAPLAGATSAVLAASPTGWEIGDLIGIGGTSPAIDSPAQTEERVITSFSTTTTTNDTVHWSEPLRFNHNHHHSLVTRTDLQPGIANLSSNIIIRSEDPSAPYWMRGHTMDMHHDCWQDLWDVEHRDLGRTFKEYYPGSTERAMGRQDGNDLDFMAIDGSDRKLTQPMTARSNIKSRYSVHNHLCGFGKMNKDTMNGCVVRNGIGWSMVHHGCEARYNRNVVCGFQGAGMVGETGNETGEWVSNLVMKTANRGGTFPKNMELQTGINGNFARTGYAFMMSGRAIVCNSNFAMDCSNGFVFYHRTDANGYVTPHGYYDTPTLDLKDLRGTKAAQAFRPKDYPIIHFADNEVTGCTYSGFYVTKGNPSQEHGWNVNLKRFKTWGCRIGAELEYVVQYAITDFDCVGNQLVTTRGISFGANVAQMAIANLRSERCNYGIYIQDSSGNYPHASYNNTTEPKYIISNHTSINDVTPLRMVDGTVGVTKVYGTTPTSVEPSNNLPRKLGDWSGGSLGGGVLTNTRTGMLTDTVSNAGALPKPPDVAGGPSDNLGIPVVNSGFEGALKAYGDDNGYWKDSSGNNILVFSLYFSDRLTAKPIKTWHHCQFSGPVNGWTNNGTYIYSPNPPVVAPANLAVPKGGSNSIDILALVSDADGGTLTLESSYAAGDHGRIKIEGGVVTYEDFGFGYTGPDLVFLFVHDGQGNSTRVDLNVTIS